MFPWKAKLIPTGVTDGEAKIHPLRTFGNAAWNQSVLNPRGSLLIIFYNSASQAMTGQLDN